MGGVNIADSVFVGAKVTFDGIHPELITIGNGTVITQGCVFLSHFYSVKDHCFYLSHLEIGNNVFIGMNTLVVKPVKIGDGSVIGAGSVVVCDIPENEVWAGNPAVFRKKIK
jgi:acetyltransferase-like isoleucine patch superfamily enzyme